jgi:hypothetical protein
LKSATRRRARILARISTMTMVTTVMNRLLRRARRKTGSRQMVRKLRRPTKSKLGSPTVTSLRL